MNTNQFGVYIHIPFCVKKCNYCDFLSFPADDDIKKRYTDALIREINAYEPDKRSVATVFFGGGTPSVLDAGYIASVLDVLRDRFRVADDAEITIECNPETLDRDKALTYIASGINRISFGLQSTDNAVLKLLGRIHTYETFVKSFSLARECGFSNINVDMMAALPGQSVEDYLSGLRKVAELKPEHISAYSLIVEEGTHIYDNIDDYPALPDEDADREMYHRTAELLEEYGLKRYEISNYARAGFESRHNLSYWELTDYIGAGLGASGFYKGVRYTNTSDMGEYLALTGKLSASHENISGCKTVCGLREFQRETRESLMEEFMFLGLRKTQGVSCDEFKHIFACDIKDVYETQITSNLRSGLLKEYTSASGESYLCLTERGTDISNTVMSDFIFDQG